MGLNECYLNIEASVRPKEQKLVSAETEYSATLAETFGRIFGRKLAVIKSTIL